jgi:hypothetical protein
MAPGISSLAPFDLAGNEERARRDQENRSHDAQASFLD